MRFVAFLKSEHAFVVLLLVLFFALRFLGLDSPLHQDEYKWPLIVNPAIESPAEIPHPPLSQFIYRTAGSVLGYDVDLRFVPLMFGAFNLLLLYAFMRRRFGMHEAMIGASIFTFVFYSVLASLMVDTDGQIMPFFFLLSLGAYLAFKDAKNLKKKALFFSILCFIVFLGMFIKVSFALVPAALALDYLISLRSELTKRRFIQLASFGVLAVAGFVALLFLAQLVFPFFNLNQSFTYWAHFLRVDRNWLQSFIQLAKSLFYLSPLVALLPFLVNKRIFSQCRVFFIYIAFGLFFYLILFDFSIGAIDRYLQMLIVPLSVIGGVLMVDLFKEGILRAYLVSLIVGCVIAFGIFFLQFVPHVVPALHPKTEWLGRILSLNWNFVYPFSGGSGPLTFYISFFVLGLTWVLSGLAAAYAFFARTMRPFIVMFLIPLSLMYSGIFIEEYLFGAINGSAPTLVRNAATFIKNNHDIERVVVYNDNGGDEIQKTGKYEKRLYTSPQFDVGEKVTTINAFSGHYLVVDAPPIDPHSVYARYLAMCNVVYTESSQKMHATIFDCRNAPPIEL